MIYEQRRDQVRDRVYAALSSSYGSDSPKTGDSVGYDYERPVVNAMLNSSEALAALASIHKETTAADQRYFYDDFGDKVALYDACILLLLDSGLADSDPESTEDWLPGESSWLESDNPAVAYLAENVEEAVDRVLDCREALKILGEYAREWGCEVLTVPFDLFG